MRSGTQALFWPPHGDATACDRDPEEIGPDCRGPSDRTVERAGHGSMPRLSPGTLDRWRKTVALTQTQLVAAVADRTELRKADAKRALAALEDVVLEELGNAQKVRSAVSFSSRSA